MKNELEPDSSTSALIDRLEQEHSAMLRDSSGHDLLWLWFSLSYASFCVMPRVLMHAMPDEWQRDMARLLREWEGAWNWPEDFDGCRVQVKKNGKLVRTPEWLTNYRHPDRAFIESLRRKP